jgi:hypothetical protein
LLLGLELEHQLEQSFCGQLLLHHSLLSLMLVQQDFKIILYLRI